MKNVTLAVDEEVLERAREYAKARGTTVNALVREHLAALVTEAERVGAAKRALRELMDKSTGRLGPDFKWNREEIYEERMLPRHERAALRGHGKD